MPVPRSVISEVPVRRARAAARAFALACAASATLAACELPAADARAPVIAGELPVVPSRPDPSVPSAESVFSVPAAVTAQDSASGRPAGPMTPSQASTQMPMPGQANNHSTTALDPARRAASAP